MAEVSGMEMLAELLKEVKRLNQKVDVLDRLVKQVANSAKVSEIATKALGTPLEGWVMPGRVKAEGKVTAKAYTADQAAVAKKQSTGGLRFNYETSDGETVQASVEAVVASAPVKCRCEGKMIATVEGRPVPLSDVKVTIFDEHDTEVKRTGTNRAGVWQSSLGPGRYVALCEGKMQGKDLYPVNIAFTVEPGMERLVVE